MLYSLYLIPPYIAASQELRAAQKALAKSDYDSAIKFYTNVLDIAPTSEKARIGMAEALFTSPNVKDHKPALDIITSISESARVEIAEAIFANPDVKDKEIGLYILEDIRLSKSQWKRIEQVMPKEYIQYFKDEKH